MGRAKPIDLSTYYGRNRFYQRPEWRLLRKIKLTHDPYCEECLKSGVHTLAEDVHHIVDIKEDPTKCLSYDNLASLCKSCHSVITSGETRGKKNEFEVVNKKWKY